MPPTARSAALLVILLGCSPAQEAELRTARGGPGPQISFEAVAHDFGEVSDAREAACDFSFVNTGDAPLTISKIDASCGCTTTSLARMTFAPGEGDAIHLVWKPTGRGRQTKTVNVLSDAVAEPALQLSVSARIEPFLKLDPWRVDFGHIPRAERRTATVAFSCVDADVIVEEVLSRSEFLAARLMVGPAGGRGVIEVAIESGAPWGMLNPRADIRVRGRPKPGEAPVTTTVSLLVSATLYDALLFEPALISVGRVLPQAPFSAELRVTRPTGQPFRVLEVSLEETTLAGIAVRAEPLSPAEGTGYRLILSGETGDHLGAVRGKVLLRTDVPGEASRSIPFMGLAR